MIAATAPEALGTTIQRGRTWILIVLLLAGLGFRCLWFPDRYEQRNGDEEAYLYDGLLLFEGIIPGHKSVPSGLMTWIEWTYVAGQSAKNIVFPTPLEKQVPTLVRPLYAMNRAIFDDYRDITGMRAYLLVWHVGFGLLTIYAAWKFGEWASGEMGAILCGGMMALLPLLHDVTGTARPLAIAIALAAACFALLSRGRFRLAAVCFGVSLGTRFEMLQLIPLVVAMVIFEVGWRRCWGVVFKCIGISLVAFMVVSPWWLITWFGNLRSVVGVRLMSVSQEVPHMTVFSQFAWTNGLFIPFLLLIASIPLAWKQKRGLLMPAAALLIVATMLVGHSQISYQSAPIMATIFVGAMGLQVLSGRARTIANALIFATLALTAAQSVYEWPKADRFTLPDEVADWVERHVPPGTRVYWPYAMGKQLLPTEKSGTAMWMEVMDDNSWRKKMSWAVGFAKPASPIDLPRVTSEDILYKERANLRMWFILAGRSEVPIPRFEVNQTHSSQFFGVLGGSMTDEFKKTGGVFVVQGTPDPSLGSPTIVFKKRWTRDVSIFVASDVKLIQ